MRKILLITNECYKSRSANGYCIENVVNALLNTTKCSIDIVAFHDKTEACFMSERVHVYYVKNVFFCANCRLGSFMNKVMRRLAFDILSPDTNILYMQRAMRVIRNLCKKEQYDLVVSSSGGYVAQLLAMKVKQEFNFKWVSYFLDPPVRYNYLFNKNKVYYRWFCKKDVEMMSCCDKVVLDECIYRAMTTDVTNNKFVSAGIPLIVRRYENYFPRMSEKEIKIAFIGTLYNDERNPEYAISLLSEIPGVSIDFYGAKLTEVVLAPYVNDHVKYCGELMHEQIGECIEKYDYLLNIANNTTAQIPSKIIEYISYLKPVINIVKKKNDITIELIQKYGLGISLIEGMPNNLEKVIEFIKTKKTDIQFEEIERRFEYYTPEFTAKRIVGDL